MTTARWNTKLNHSRLLHGEWRATSPIKWRPPPTPYGAGRSGTASCHLPERAWRNDFERV
eukprot:5338313-Pleurochrysis_carterae.AAC.1